MYLKEIKTYGFKSFADKTIIELGKNINGIVGPNGSGKSNIVDAVRWVLGEQSMKSLRGDTSSDVIFSGSESRKPLNSASVTLVFDNEDRSLPIDFNEVAIKRIAFRTGESEYYINNERVRLKDLSDLLMESGTAKESFNIISQGKIDEILSTKAEDRRIIFEEAAGVLKYKKRKEEAFRKLEKTNQNINRVSDIISEISSTIGPMEEASHKAKKYMAIKDKLSNLEVATIAKNISLLNFEYQEDKKKIEALENEISSSNASMSSYDIDILKYKKDLEKIREEMNEKQSRLIELSRKEEVISSDIKLLQERNKYRDDKSRIANNIILLKEELLNINSYLLDEKNSLDVIDRKIELLEKEMFKLKEDYNSNLNKKNSYNNILDKNSRDIESLKYRIEYLENSLSNNTALPKPIKMILENPKFTGVHNVISALIDTKSEYKVAVSTSLASSSFYLVVDTPDTAKELITYLKNNNLGRATFYPLSVITGRNIDEQVINIIARIEGYVGIASSLVTYNSKYENIISNVLGNIIIARDIDSANKISSKVNKKYKVVTLDGQVVNPGGSLTGGSLQKNNNYLSIKYEIEEAQKKLDSIKEKNKDISKEIVSMDKILVTISQDIFAAQSKDAEYQNQKNNIMTNINSKEKEKENKEKELGDLTSVTTGGGEEDNLIKSLSEVRERISNLNKEISIKRAEEESISTTVAELEETSKNSTLYVNKKERELNSLNIAINRTEVKLDNLLATLTSDYNMTYDFAIQNYKLDMDIDEAKSEVNKLKDELTLIGNVNLDAPAEYEKLKERFDFLSKQKDDLLSAESTLYDIIKEMDSVMKEKLMDTFEQVRKEFKVVYRELFKGGKAELSLTNPDNILETGIEIKAEPPGKKLQSISLLSGGEKTFTAISLLFAILNVRPVPFCLFDEVEAALDDANVEAFGQYLNKYRDKTQFILITHKKKTMEYADILYGITMEESGVSKMVSVKLEDIKK